MLRLDPFRRISMRNALNDKYFDEIRSEVAPKYEKMDKKSK